MTEAYAPMRVIRIVDRAVKSPDNLRHSRLERPERRSGPERPRAEIMRSKLTPRGKERREQLIACAAQLFAERGYHPTSVADIVDALGVGKGVFYWYFQSKQELLTELLKSSNHELRKRQQQAIGDEADPVRRIERGIRASLEWFHAHREYFAIIQFAATDETFAPVLARNREISLADTIRHLKEGIVEGSIRDGDPEMLAHSIHGVVAELTRAYLIERDEPVDHVAGLAVAFCLQGLRG
jgi:TetR/AcrR family transcriptional regulator, cholesterol catabolism regulator